MSESQPTPPASSGFSGSDAGKVTVKVQWPYTSFDSGITGVPLITQAGVRVAADIADQVQEKADVSKIPLERSDR